MAKLSAHGAECVRAEYVRGSLDGHRVIRTIHPDGWILERASWRHDFGGRSTLEGTRWRRRARLKDRTPAGIGAYRDMLARAGWVIVSERMPLGGAQ